MFDKSVLKTFLFFGLMVVSLGACSGSGDGARSSGNGDGASLSDKGDDARFSGEGEVVDRKSFLKAYADCKSKVSDGKDGRLVMNCVTRIFNKQVDDYCADKGMSAAHEKCAQLHGRVAIDLMMNAGKDLEEAMDAANSRSK
jgi:hypothetical protein